MSRAGRSAAVVCRCRAFGCVQLRFRDRNGQWALGALVSTTTRASHAIADMHTAARFGGTQDSDEDSDSDNNSAGIGSEVPELNIDRLALSSQRPAPSPAARSNVYDCSPYHNFSLRHASPAVLHMSLLAAILTVCDHTSLQTASWLLKSGRELLALTASGALGKFPNKPLDFRQEETLKNLPSDAQTLIKWFKIDPKLVRVTCCPSCFAMYPQPDPQSNPQAKGSKIPAAPIPPKCINLVFPHGNNLNVAALREAASPCQADLYQLRKNTYCPLKTYAYQNLYDWLARLFSHPGVEAALESVAALSSTPFNPDHEANGELVGLWDDVEDPNLAALHPPAETDDKDPALLIGMQFFNHMEFQSDSDDNSFSPCLDAEGWDTGSWT
ncbi:hypothetical protein PtB15_1B671 [Puccinia triticina]|nr:hypothetical protein PtB15_1B671 [Puccinia triticina]